MSKLILALFCGLLTAPVLAQDRGNAATSSPVAAQAAAQGSVSQTPADEAPADVDMANVRSAGAAASAPSAAAPGQSPAAQGGGQQTVVEQPKSAIPLDKRQGPDITKCLEAGDKSDKAINACADKYRPRTRR